MPALLFFLWSTLLLTEVTAIDGIVIVDSTTVSVFNGVYEGSFTPAVNFDVTFAPSPLATYSVGGAGTSQLWTVDAFFTSDPTGGIKTSNRGILLNTAQETTLWQPPASTTISGLNALQVPVPGGVVCSDMEYFCAIIGRNNGSSPSFQLTARNDSVSFLGCVSINCRGVEITGTQVSITSGDIREGVSQSINFDVTLNSDAAAGSVSGSDLWQITPFLRLTSGAFVTVLTLPNAVLTTLQGNTPLIAGIPTTISGVSIFADLTRVTCTQLRGFPGCSGTGINAGTRANIMGVTADLNLEDTLCTELAGICVVLQQQNPSSIGFTFDPQPDSNVLTSCVPATCTGVQVTNINFNLISGAQLQAASDNNAITLDLNILTDGDGAGVSGSNLWQIELFLNSQIDGQGRTTLSQLTSIPALENSQSLAAGLLYTLEDVATTLNLRNMDCATLPFVCVRLSKNPGSSPAFTLSELSPASLVSCQSLPCTDPNECEPNPCLNGGTCTDGVNSFSCTCRAGYYGPICDEGINECNSDPCQNGGTCAEGVDSFTCTCAPGYTGTFCTEVYPMWNHNTWTIMLPSTTPML
eukprot:XP_011661540.1 PREDICTED: uncharacterized protein LOC105437059 [Strongylocentrotus purpuratus]